jgi:hypothetical protein
MQKRLDALYSVIQIAPNGQVTIGSPLDPVDNFYVDNIGSLAQPVNNLYTEGSVADSFNLKGICLDDNTAALTPSFLSFPKQWLNNPAPVASVRTYHYLSGLGNNDRTWVKWLIQNSISVVIGITLSNYQEELNTLASDYLVTKSLYDQFTLAIVVGNEEDSSKIPTIQAGIAYARSLIQAGNLPNTKVTTVLKDDGNWLVNTYPPENAEFTPNFALLEPSLDIICFNMYDAYYAPAFVPVTTKLSWTSRNDQRSVTLNGFGAVRNAMRKRNYIKPFWCTEVGWQWPKSNSENPGNSLDNLKTFYTNFLAFNMTDSFVPELGTIPVTPPNRILYFTIRDVPGMDETFGLYTKNENLTPKF